MERKEGVASQCSSAVSLIETHLKNHLRGYTPSLDPFYLVDELCTEDDTNDRPTFLVHDGAFTRPGRRRGVKVQVRQGIVRPRLTDAAQWCHRCKTEE